MTGHPVGHGLGGGKFLTLWSAESSEHAYGQLYGQIFSSDGSVHQAKFRVADFDSYYGRGTRSATVLPDGSFVVSFSAHDNIKEPGYGVDVYFRRFDADGLPLADATQANIVNNEHQHYSSIVNDGENMLIPVLPTALMTATAKSRLVPIGEIFGETTFTVSENSDPASVIFDAEATQRRGDL